MHPPCSYYDPSLRTHRHLTAVLAGIAALLGTPAWAAQELQVTAMSIEDLLNVEVTTVSRKAQRLTDTAAAAFVLTAEDIQRSGSTSIPEALRLVPGLEVARISGSRWAVTARGFNGRFANKLLVLVDGRSAYSPFFSGVFWEAEDVLLEDVERIEVIRGPGATMWGANAVNGVINVLTRHARRTQGGLVTALTGNEGQRTGAVRWGAQVDDDTHYRLWAKSIQRDSVQANDGTPGSDDVQALRAGVRLDRDLSGRMRLMATANVFDAQSGEVLMLPQLTPPYATRTPTRQKNQGAQALGKIDWTLDNGSQGTLQIGLEQSRIEMDRVHAEDRTTLDLDFQNRFALTSRQDLVWGLGYRRSADAISTPPMSLSTFLPPAQTQTLYSAFVHDEFTVVPDRWRIAAGSKFEHNSYTGFEIQPNLRSSWSLNPTDAVWAAVSRAVRTPARVERGARIDAAVLPADPAGGNPLPTLLRIGGSPAFSSESVLSYEVGYRAQFGSNLLLDLTAFHNRYRHLRAGRTLGASPVLTSLPPYLLVSSEISNSLDAQANGVEAAVDWHATPNLRLQAAGTWLQIKAEPDGDPMHDLDVRSAEGGVPRHQLSLRASYELGTHQQLDGWVRRVGRLDALDIGAYTTLDLRWAWRVTPQFEVSVIGQNLLRAQHVEFTGDQLPTLQMRVPRTVAVKGRWQF